MEKFRGHVVRGAAAALLALPVFAYVRLHEVLYLLRQPEIAEFQVAEFVD